MSWHSLPIFRDNDLYVDFNMLWEVGGYTSNHVYTRAVFEVLLRNTSHEPALRRLSSGGPCGQQARKCIGGRPPSPPAHLPAIYYSIKYWGASPPSPPLCFINTFLLLGDNPPDPLNLGGFTPKPPPSSIIFILILKGALPPPSHPQYCSATTKLFFN